MDNIILFDSDLRTALRPLTTLRPASELRVGILTIQEKWQLRFPESRFSHITEEYIEPLFPIAIEESNVLINSALIPTSEISTLIKKLEVNQAILCKDELIATRLERQQFDRLLSHNSLDVVEGIMVDPISIKLLTSAWDILDVQAEEIANDIELLIKNDQIVRHHAPDRGDYPVYMAGEIDLSGVFFDTSKGAIYIGADATLLPGAHLQGPVAIGAGSVVKMGACIYGATSIGPKSTVAGEIKNTSIQGYSNKGHEGYLGDSILGCWCNLGALTTVSNLKNSFGPVTVWDMQAQNWKDSDRQKLGLLMGDYSRTAILQKIGSGTTVGVSSNVMSSDFAAGWVPAFSWGTKDEVYQLEKATLAAQQLHLWKEEPWTDAHIEVLNGAYEFSKSDRNLLD